MEEVTISDTCIQDILIIVINDEYPYKAPTLNHFKSKDIEIKTLLKSGTSAKTYTSST